MAPQKDESWQDRILRKNEDGKWITWKEYLEHAGQKVPVKEENLSKSHRPALFFHTSGRQGDQRRGNVKEIEICSKYLIDAINKVNKHPSLGKQETDSIRLSEPFSVLYWHLRDIRDEIAQLNTPQASIDFQALEFIADEMMDRWNVADTKTLDSGFVRYDTIWQLFRPGDLVLRQDKLGNEWLLTLVEVNEHKSWRKEKYTAEEQIIEKKINFVTWGLVWDATKNQLTRKVAIFSITPFKHLTKVTSLPVYPIPYKEGSKARDEFFTKLAVRGRKWFNLLTGQTQCLRHHGLAYNPPISPSNPFSVNSKRDYSLVAQVNDRVVIETYTNMRSGFQLDFIEGFDKKSLEDINILDVREQYSWDNLPASTKLTDEQARLCIPVIGCYSVSSKNFHMVDVERLEEVKWNVKAMDSLVLEQEKKDMLQGLVDQHYSKSRRNQGGDLIAGKGEGLIMLLYGPPGVGKTLTVESLAEKVGKPLISLSIGNIIHDSSRLEQRLEDEFRRAIDWDAILLLDEADVVLEARSFEDLRRNSIVTVFLRQLEYYTGVLFLTTNRIGTMDLAFQSRIQVGIGFKNLSFRVRRDIWRSLLDLNRNDGVISTATLDESVDKLDQLASLELNGRQIRNVLNIAKGYAFHEFGGAGHMGYRHIEKAARAALDFQQLFDEERSYSKTEQSVWAPYRET